MGTPALRPLQIADLPALADVWVASWQETMPAIDFSARRDWLLAFLQDNAGRTTLVALDEQGVPCGFATLESGTCVLHQLAVASAEAPRGLTLEVNQANRRAVRFYEREGFVRTGVGVNETSGLATWRMGWRSEV